MNKRLLLLLCSISFSSFASDLLEGNCSKDQLIAKYKIDGNTTNQVTFIRAKQQRGIIDANQKVAELWHRLPNRQVALTRYFTQYQRGIEYQPADLGKNINWQVLSAPIFPTQITDIKKLNSQGVGCQRTEHYALKNNHQTIELTWLPELNLAKHYVLKQLNSNGEYQVKVSWRLSQLSFNHSEQTINQWQQWPTVDYADIGDNENDPFLAKMINQGFIKHHGQAFSFHQH